MDTNGSEDLNGFEPAGFFALRTPLLPVDEWLRWSDGVEAPAKVADAERLYDALLADRIRLRAHLQTIVTRLEVREALFLASPDLEVSIDLWQQEPESDRGRRIERALVRYFSRMSGRATPFGLFAGCSVGHPGNYTHLVIEGQDKYQPHTRLDVEYLEKLIAALNVDQRLQKGLAYHPNSSLYQTGGRWHYAEARVQDRRRTHHLVGVEATDYLDATLVCAAGGASLQRLATMLVERDGEISPAEAEEFIRELIDGGVLVSELELPITGAEPIDHLVAQLNRHREAAPVADRLVGAQQELRAIAAAGLGNSPARYRLLAAWLSQLPSEVELKRLFQADMIKPASRLTLGPEPLAEMMRGVEILRRLQQSQDDELKVFRERFVERYERREVPLVEALDDESGIGFESSRDARKWQHTGELSDEEPYIRLVRGGRSPAPWSKPQTLLMTKLLEAQRCGSDGIELTEDDLKALGTSAPPPLPDAFAVAGTIWSSAASSSGGDFQVELNGVHGPSGATLLGRFCHADPTLHQLVREHLRREESLRPDAVFAEVVHLPAGRTGNILTELGVGNVGRAAVSTARHQRAVDSRESKMEREPRGITLAQQRGWSCPLRENPGMAGEATTATLRSIDRRG